MAEDAMHVGDVPAATAVAGPALLAGHVDKRRLAEEFGVSERTVDRWCNEPGGLPHIKLGRRTLFKIESVKAWLARREVQRNKRRGTG